MTATWKVPEALTKETEYRATKMQVIWVLGTTSGRLKRVVTTTDMGTTSHSIWINNFDTGTKTYTRDDFYPVKKNLLSYVGVYVRVGNEKGWSSTMPNTSYNFEKPLPPVIGSFSVDANGKVSVSGTVPAGAGKYERYDIIYSWTAKNSSTGEVIAKRTGTVRGTSFSLSVDVPGYQALGTSCVECVCTVQARGFKGVSVEVKKGYCLAYPNTPSIEEINAPTGLTGTVLAKIKTNHTYWHPCTKVQLQALVNSEYDTATEAAGAGDEWSDVGGPDNGNCTALAVPVADVRPAIAGRHSWLRVKSNGPVENVLVSYSRPKELTTLYRPPYTATGDIVRILDAHAGEDGKSVVVLLAWAPTGSTDNSTGTELSWSNELDTWRSTDEPDTFNVLYDDGSVTWTDPSTGTDTTYQHSATITIKGLDEGETTYIKARRYHEGEDVTTYGDYCETVMVTPAQIPASVVLEVAAFVAEGEGITATWTYDGGATQDAWALLDGSGTIIVDGQNALGTATISAERAAEIAVDGEIELSVTVSMGGAWVTSEAKTVTIVERPELTATTAATLTAQPMQIAATCDSGTASLTIIVTSDGVSGYMPGGMAVQADGDVVWSGVVTPEWTSGAATVTLPEGLDFWDGAGYTATVTATDPDTGLSSETVELHTDVAWSHQAPDPDGCVTLTPIDTMDVYGVVTKGVQIDLVPPTGYASGDLYDVYRLTGDGPQLIGEGYPLTVTTLDGFAPYGTGMEHAYRIACRTADGDVQWADVPYALDGDMLRIDWADQYVELPYNIALDDSYAKDMDVHEYLDGSTDVYFNHGVRRTAKLSTDVLRLEDADVIAAVLDLAHHIGAAFVRTPSGAAYEAAVQVDSVTPTHELAAVSISATEIRLTADYMLPPFNVVDEDEGEGE